MALDPKTLPPAQAWAPLKPEEWNAENARHLLRRMGFAATPEQLTRSIKIGLPATLQEAFGQVRQMTPSPALAQYVEERQKVAAQLRVANQAADGQQRQQLNVELNRMQRQAYVDGVMEWLTFARQPENSPQENLVMFLGDVLVIAFSKVKAPDRLYRYTDLLRASWQKPYPEIIKAVTHSAAMIEYLDLNTSLRGTPNENYARELMELFTLGEGHYTEADIKEAARALTGNVIRGDQGAFAPNRWDNAQKTIFGRRGNWRADDVVDIIFQQPAANTFLPKEFLRWYLAEDALPAAYGEQLGSLWVQQNRRVDALAKIVFSSKLFYLPEFRGTLIKSPIRYYLGLCQDLDLDVSPLEQQILQNFRAMGQEPFNPPNVRGWVGGKSWINSSTLSARRQVVQQLFTATNETTLNADQQMMLSSARAQGRGVISMAPERVQKIANLAPEVMADELLNYFLPGAPKEVYRAAIVNHMMARGDKQQLAKEVAIALLQSPDYHLC